MTRSLDPFAILHEIFREKQPHFYPETYPVIFRS